MHMVLTPEATLEALLFAEGGPLSLTQLRTLMELDNEHLAIVVDALERSLSGRGISLVRTTSEIELRTSPDAADAVRKLRESELSRDLGKASLETLAVILYRGTATRSEIDYVRGVNSSASLRILSLRGLIERIEDKTDKRRARYQGTLKALAHLGVTNIEELPRYTELSTLVEEAELRTATPEQEL